ncbi:mannitol dehydrogenase family protein [Plantibacter sp. Mn2098]|uniref:mannitol dehydrogenase family protein n=1 Tax=Plantibacter sp. Mn2098 TaxID=3395266 RepID=UPI003BCBE8AF
MSDPATRAPVRIVHLGLGAFHRAHQAWYTHLANELTDRREERWGIAAFTGRSPAAAVALNAQDDVYTLIERGADTDGATRIESIVEAHDGADGETWRRLLADARVAVLTLTVTEAGYRLGADGGLDWSDADVQRDLVYLTPGGDSGPGGGGAAAVTAPGRIVDGLLARRAAGSGAIAVVSCDNLDDNGGLIRHVVLDLAGRVDTGLAEWITANTSFVSTMVDRITPATTPADAATAERLTGIPDAVPVVCEPFSEWVLAGDFPAGRPAWESVGARFVDDIAPAERRKLWLLNAGHSLLAYRGLLAGHRTIAEAMEDADCLAALKSLWSDVGDVLDLDRSGLDAALASLRTRFTNARIEHRLVQIAGGGSQKLRVRIIDVIRARLDAGLPAGDAHCGVIADWIAHLDGTDVTDQGAAPLIEALGRFDRGDDQDRAAAAVRFLAPDLADLPGVIDPIVNRLKHTVQHTV